MFQFKNFGLYHENSALKIGTDAVLLAAATPVDGVRSVLDIGCGCGVIAYCLAWKMKSCDASQQIVGIDIDESSIAEAKRNLTVFPAAPHQQIDFYHQSIQQFAEQSPRKFDLIVSNPPFFVHSLKANSPQKNISKHNDALPFEDLMNAVDKLLSDQGKFFVILPKNESEIFNQLTVNQFINTYQLVIRPTPAKAVNRIISAYQKIGVDTLWREELTIRNSNNDFTDEYKALTRDFYLKF